MLFWNVSLGGMDRSMHWYCDTIPGTRELLSVKSKDMRNMFSIDMTKYYDFVCLNCCRCMWT